MTAYFSSYILNHGSVFAVVVIIFIFVATAASVRRWHCV